MPRPRMFTDAEVVAMRERYAAGVPLREIAPGRVSLGPLHMLLLGRSYANVGGPIALPGIRVQALLRKRAKLSQEIRAIDRLLVIGGAA